VAQLGRPLQDTNTFYPLPRPLSNYLQAGVWRWGPIARTKMDRKKQKPRRKPHRTQRALSWGRGAARAAAARQKYFLPPLKHPLSRPLCSLECGAGALWPRLKWTAKNKNHAASPTSCSARGAGGVAQLGRPPQDKKNLPPTTRSLTHSGGRRKTKIIFAPYHTPSHTLPVG
jgi:hypothetical protein